ncbi:MAG: glutaredoxin family protein [Candidatus Velamenicoccus archaeovorus]
MARTHDVIVLTSPGCHLCEDALEGLAGLAADLALSVREVAMGSGEGRDLVERFRPSVPPGVIVDGRLFSSGRLPRKKLRRHLERAALEVV